MVALPTVSPTGCPFTLKPVTGLLKSTVTGIGEMNVPGESADVNSTEGRVVSKINESGAAAALRRPMESCVTPVGTCTLTVNGPLTPGVGVSTKL